jgi:hypothetical protein
MEPEAFLDAFARQQQAGLGALARLSRPDDWDPPLAPPSNGGGWPPAEEPDIPDVTFRSPRHWN